MKEQIYILKEDQPFKIRYINQTGDRKNFLWFLPEIVNISAEGGKWYMFTIFVFVKFFVIFPVVILIEIFTLFFRGLVAFFKWFFTVTIPFILKEMFTTLVKIFGKVTAFILVIISLVLMVIIIYNHFSEIIQFSEKLFKTILKL